MTDIFHRPPRRRNSGGSTGSIDSESAFATKLNEVDVSGQDSADFTTNVDSSYARYLVVANGAISSDGAGNISLRFSRDGGSNWDDATGDYDFTSNQFSSGGSNNKTARSDAGKVVVCGPEDKVENQAGGGADIMLHIRGAADSSAFTAGHWEGSFIGGGGTSGNACQQDGAFKHSYTEAVDGIRLQMTDGGGTFAGGTVELYGVSPTGN